MNQILVTGGHGFIGSNLVEYLHAEHSDWVIHNVDSLTYAAEPRHLAHLDGDVRYRFHRVDITDRERLAELFDNVRPDGIFHLAAETHVDNSIHGPAQFMQTNIIGTYNLLEEARALWAGQPGGRFLHVSTDEVYGSLGAEGAFSEESQYQPNSPYSASKAGSDHLVRAWHHTYGLDVVTTNCSNNYGPRQHREKLIPTVIATALAGKPIPVYGQGTNVRDWLFVRDHCAALDRVFSTGTAGETYMIGGRNEWKNLDLVRLICQLLDEEVGDRDGAGHASLITYVTDRPGHDLRYAIDPTKIERELGWSAATSFQDGLRETVKWYCRLYAEQEIG